MDDAQVYVQGQHDNADDSPKPYGADTWEVVDENEGGVVAYAGDYDLTILIRDAIRAAYAPFKVGDHIRTLDTQEVIDYALEPGWRGVITQVHDDGEVSFLTHDEIDDGETFPWLAQPDMIELDK